MIIAWTLFVITGLFTLLAAFCAVYDFCEGDTKEAAKTTWYFILYLVCTACVAQYIFGG